MTQLESQPEATREAERINNRRLPDHKAGPPPKALFRLLGRYYSGLNLTLSITEWMIFLCALPLGVAFRFDLRLPPETTSGELVLIGIVYATVMSLSITAMGLYQRGMHDADAGRFRLAMAFIGGTAALALVYYLVPSISIGRGVIGLTLLFSFLGSVVLREGWRRLAGTNVTTRRVLVVGAGNNARRIADLSAAIPALGFTVIGYLPLPRSDGMLPEETLIRHRARLLDKVSEESIDEIVVACDDRSALPIDELLDCRLSGIMVLDQLDFFERELSMIDIALLKPDWIVFSRNGFRLGITGLLGKRLLDLTLGSLMLILTAPLMALVAAASLIESGGRHPILYHQTRVGQGGVPFRLYKFRSMRVDAEADGKARWADHNDVRITRLGAFLRRTRLDELPQLFNVLRGQMSLVGPRPERPEFVDRLGATIPFYAERHRLKPGLTGWAQLYYPYGSTDEDAKRKLEFDLYYVKHASIVLDLIVLVQTVEVVLFGKGAR
jgi:sugar transferase (PEP-CTERM system associated)